MIGKEVEVISGGTRYYGVLIEVSDIEVHLKTLQQWLALPIAAVGDIRLKETVKRNSEPLPEGG